MDRTHFGDLEQARALAVIEVAGELDPALETVSRGFGCMAAVSDVTWVAPRAQPLRFA